MDVMEKMEGSASSAIVGHSEIDIDLIIVEAQPRYLFDESKIEGLAESFISVGFIQQNLLVEATKDGKYLLVTGERRLRAARLLVSRGNKDFQFVPCEVKAFSSAKERFLSQVVENAQREDLHPFEDCDEAILWNKNFDNEKGWRARFCQHKSISKQALSLLLKFDKFDKVFKTAVINNSKIATPRRIDKLYSFDDRKLVLKLLRRKLSFPEILKVLVPVGNTLVDLDDSVDNVVNLDDSSVESTDDVNVSEDDGFGVDFSDVISNENGEKKTVVLGEVSLVKLDIFIRLLELKKIDVKGDLVGYINGLSD